MERGPEWDQAKEASDATKARYRELVTELAGPLEGDRFSATSQYLLDDGRALIADRFDDGRRQEVTLILREINHDNQGQPYALIEKFAERDGRISKTWDTSRDRQMWPQNPYEHTDATPESWPVEREVQGLYRQYANEQKLAEDSERVPYVDEPELDQLNALLQAVTLRRDELRLVD